MGNITELLELRQDILNEIKLLNNILRLPSCNDRVARLENISFLYNMIIKLDGILNKNGVYVD